jgi:hypothetical protein
MRERYDDVAYHTQDGPCITILRDKRVKAAKQYQCCLCTGPIAVGELHVNIVYVNHDVAGDPLCSDRYHGICPLE